MDDSTLGVLKYYIEILNEFINFISRVEFIKSLGKDLISKIKRDFKRVGGWV